MLSIVEKDYGTPQRESAKLVTLTIDGREVTVPEGTTILEAARSMGVAVPTLCWYPKLPIVGNCRICLVSVEGTPKLVASCATPAADGQKVTTESHAAVQNRKAVLGMLLERYPVEEIPVDGARNEFEQYVRRYDVPTDKRSPLGLRTGDEREGDPLIQHDMSTCILCTRCVRACEDIQVVGVLETGYRGEHGEQARETEAFVERLRGAIAAPVETFDERFTSVLAGGDDARAAAHLLSGYLERWQGGRA